MREFTIRTYVSGEIANEQGTAFGDAQAMRHHGGERTDAEYKSRGTDLPIGHV